MIYSNLIFLRFALELRGRVSQRPFFGRSTVPGGRAECQMENKKAEQWPNCEKIETFDELDTS